jgi:uncharacterized membrane protein YfcA
MAAAGAGFVDAVAGGGGLIQVPSLFSVYPTASPATLLGTNKVASIGGTLIAAKKYLKVVKLPYFIVMPAILFAFAGSFAGAAAVRSVSLDVFRILLPAILVVLLIYTIKQPSLGATHAPPGSSKHRVAQAVLLGGGIGFYDGFFGPGTGSFLLIGFVRIFGFDFLHASAATKLVNAATNLAAIILFASFGHVQWALGFAMMLMNILGSIVGSGYAVRYGNGFVRKIFIAVVSVLILKTGVDGLRYFGVNV